MKQNQKWKQKSVCLLLTLFLILVTGAISFAGEPTGNGRKGKYLYRKIYNECQARGEVESRTPLLSPNKKTMAQWDRMFTKKDFEDFKCKEEWSKLSEKELQDIYAYLHKHAADSPTPAKCK
jgi:hypothetical protein